MQAVGRPSAKVEGLQRGRDDVVGIGLGGVVAMGADLLDVVERHDAGSRQRTNHNDR